MLRESLFVDSDERLVTRREKEPVRPSNGKNLDCDANVERASWGGGARAYGGRLMKFLMSPVRYLLNEARTPSYKMYGAIHFFLTG